MSNRLWHVVHWQDLPQPVAGSIEGEDGVSIAQHCPCWHNRCLPLHFRDMLPDPLMPLPPSVSSTMQEMSMPKPAFISMPLAVPASSSQINSSSTSIMNGLVNSIPLLICCMFRTQKNKFSIYQVYHTELIPSITLTIHSQLPMNM